MDWSAPAMATIINCARTIYLRSVAMEIFHQAQINLDNVNRARLMSWIWIDKRVAKSLLVRFIHSLNEEILRAVVHEKN